MSRQLRRNREFAALWASTAISHLGTMFEALSLTALLFLDATPAQMGVLAAATTAPALVVALLAGVWVDRLPRRPVLVAADFGRFALLLTVPVAALVDRLSMEQVYVVAFGAGCLEVMFDLAYRSLLPSIVPDGQLVDANAGLRMGESVAGSVGPTIGGGIVQAAGAPVAVLIDAFTFVASGLLLGLVRERATGPMVPGVAVPLVPQVKTQGIGVLKEALEGVRTATREPALRAILGLSCTYGFFGSFLITLFALRVLRELGLSPLMLGLLVGAGGLGSFAGAALAGPATRHIGLGPSIVVAYIFATLADLTIPLAGGSPWTAFAILGLGYFFSDLFYVIHGVAAMSLRQAITPERQLGRVNATFLLVNRSLRPAGSVVAGLTAEVIGVQQALFIGGAGIVGASAWLILSPLPRMKTAPSATSGSG